MICTQGRPWAAGRWMGLMVFALVAAGCAQTKTFEATSDFERPQEAVRVLLMPPDVELYEVTAAGLQEPKADWTAAGERNVRAAVEKLMRRRDAELVEYQSPEAQIALLRPQHVQLVKLHQAVGRSILTHKYLDQFALPTKKDSFDWTLGQGAAALRNDYNADFALFIYFRDSFASAGRAAVIVVGAVLGVGVSGGHQEGFASLVHLRSGDIVWFNVLSSSGGDLRDPAMAEGATYRLLTGLPL